MIGRLGNQMFQIANVYAQSLRHNRQLVLPRNDTSVSDYFSTVHRKLDFILDKSPDQSDAVHVIDGTYHHTDYVPHETKPTVFRGYYETEKYFLDYSSNIKWLFGPTPEFVNQAITDYPQLKSGSSSAIIVRRGDFLTFPTRHPVVTIDYISEAFKLLPPTSNVFIISDDIPWCRENIALSGAIFVSYVTWKALWLASLCDHFVISNSTFAWWGAYLSQNPSKVVVTPSTWFGPDITVDTKDIRCPSWLTVPTKWGSDGFIHIK